MAWLGARHGGMHTGREDFRAAIYLAFLKPLVGFLFNGPGPSSSTAATTGSAPLQTRRDAQEARHPPDNNRRFCFLLLCSLPSLVPLVLPPRNDRPSPSSPSPLPLSVDSPPEPPCGPQLTGSAQGQGLRAQKANSVVVCESTCPHLHRQHWSHDRQRARQPLACPQTRWGLASLPWLAVLGQSARGGRAR